MKTKEEIDTEILQSLMASEDEVEKELKSGERAFSSTIDENNIKLTDSQLSDRIAKLKKMIGTEQEIRDDCGCYTDNRPCTCYGQSGEVNRSFIRLKVVEEQ